MMSKCSALGANRLDPAGGAAHTSERLILGCAVRLHRRFINYVLMMRHVYLDHAATTPLDPAVLEVMVPHLKQDYGNPSSVHRLGRKARFVMEESRERVAAVLGCEPGEIIFTSGGTEADNTALKGLLQGGRGGGRAGLLTSAAEHEAVVRPAERLREEGHPVELLAPERHGAVTAEQVDSAVDEQTGLVSIMHVNNELGTLSPIEAIAAVCHRHGIPLHCDAVQSAGLLPVDVDELGVDLLSLSAHKFYGPKGVGVLYVRGGVEVVPLVEGGSQERARRGGTENVAAVVGLAEALERSTRQAGERAAHVAALRDRLYHNLSEALDAATFVCNTPVAEAGVEAAPHVLNLAFPPVDGQAVDGEMLLLNLDMEGVCASAGSACTSGALEPSHVLTAIGLDRPTAAAAVRFSLGKDNKEEDVDYAADRLAAILQRMRG